MRSRLRWPGFLCSLLATVAAWARPLSVSELNYSPLNSSDYEFIELINSGTTPFDLTGCHFTASVTYTFGSRVLQPGDRVVVCRDRTKFASIYGNIPNLAPGASTTAYIVLSAGESE